jgi:hypothetical protein
MGGKGFGPLPPGLEALELRRSRMEMRVVVPDATSLTSLAEQLGFAVGSERISTNRERSEVDVRVDQDSDWRVLRVLSTVEWWRCRAGVSVEMWLGERSCTLG